jgi:hypothetical protein
LPFSVGDVLPETVSSKTRHGFVILTGSEDAAQALARADRVRELIQVDVAQTRAPRTVGAHK